MLENNATDVYLKVSVPVGKQLAASKDAAGALRGFYVDTATGISEHANLFPIDPAELAKSRNFKRDLIVVSITAAATLTVVFGIPRAKKWWDERQSRTKKVALEVAANNLKTEFSLVSAEKGEGFEMTPETFQKLMEAALHLKTIEERIYFILREAKLIKPSVNVVEWKSTIGELSREEFDQTLREIIAQNPEIKDDPKVNELFMKLMNIENPSDSDEGPEALGASTR